jgi:hypothetical protein
MRPPKRRRGPKEDKERQREWDHQRNEESQEKLKKVKKN